MGTNATVGHLADVLERIGRRSIAEKLLGEYCQGFLNEFQCCKDVMNS